MRSVVAPGAYSVLSDPLDAFISRDELWDLLVQWRKNAPRFPGYEDFFVEEYTEKPQLVVTRKAKFQNGLEELEYVFTSATTFHHEKYTMDIDHKGNLPGSTLDQLADRTDSVVLLEDPLRVEAVRTGKSGRNCSAVVKGYWEYILNALLRGDMASFELDETLAALQVSQKGQDKATAGAEGAQERGEWIIEMFTPRVEAPKKKAAEQQAEEDKTVVLSTADIVERAQESGEWLLEMFTPRGTRAPDRQREVAEEDKSRIVEQEQENGEWFFELFTPRGQTPSRHRAVEEDKTVIVEHTQESGEWPAEMLTPRAKVPETMLTPRAKVTDTQAS
eukprot:CAMPEP_0178466806 /NCGR_PEP_ID=MMETSP0689_2-20121128/52091_1 /TAXON_ID=160604 /ORGANISM="Amphidinium massartii, Strain CS-259" /LENGTH=332 /DNA_ID=CAMNT_0020093837 /DNA_START=266 /DNA_END=1264 /DNA_ORIENTATION=+